MSESTESIEKNERKRANDDPTKGDVDLPRKKFYRQRAHVNPLSTRPLFHPKNPESMPWKEYFGEKYNDDMTLVRNVDVGCGYGGLLFKLSTVFPDDFSVGMEIREKVSRFVMDKITAKRHNEPGNWQNICCLRTNTMRYISNFFAKAQLERMFFLYPDPHFKKSKIKWRIISVPLISEYAYLIRPGGVLYTITDVLQYHQWVLECFACTKLFVKVDEDDLKTDPIFEYLFDSSEEGQKVSRNDGEKYHAIYRRTAVEAPSAPSLTYNNDTESEDKINNIE